MLRQFVVYLLVAGLLLECSPGNKAEKRRTPSDTAVFDLLDRLKKNPDDKEAAEQLPEAYQVAYQTRRDLNTNTYANMSEGDRWMEISKQLEVAQQLHTEIRANPAASKIIPNPWDPTVEIQQARSRAAEEFYNQGVAF